MNNNLLQIKIKERLNKRSSNDYDSIECWKIAEAFNKAQLEWVRRQIDPVNPNIAGDEQNLRRVDDLQILLVSKNLAGVNKPVFFDSETIPENYLAYKRVSVKGKSGTCPDRIMKVYLVEEANADLLLTDNHSKPSFEWGETFCTMFGNKVRIYSNGEFSIKDPTLIYYRKPREVEFSGCVNPSTGNLFTANQTCEFKDDITELIIDEAAAILAGDIESMLQYQRNTANAERNN